MDGREKMVCTCFPDVTHTDLAFACWQVAKPDAWRLLVLRGEDGDHSGRERCQSSSQVCVPVMYNPGTCSSAPCRARRAADPLALALPTNRRKDRPNRPNGLTKQTYSALVYLPGSSHPRKWHVVAYFTVSLCLSKATLRV